MVNRSREVEAFVEGLEHPLKAEIMVVRELILASNDTISERIKWNAPSFCFGGDDRVTMKLHPPRQLQLILHRGAKVKDSSNFVFKDDSGLVKWVAKDRGVVTLRNMDDVRTNRGTLVALVNQWMNATTDVRRRTSTP